MAKVTITIVNDAEETLDTAEATMSDEALNFVVEAMAVARGWTEESGVTKARWFSWELRKYAERQVDWYAHKLAADAAALQAEAIKSTVYVA